jgi:transposase
MTIDPHREAQILRLFHAEQWPVGTIARQLGLHHTTVRRAIARSGDIAAAHPRPARIDPFLPFILQTLEQFPTLTASRLYAMVKARGYVGSPDHFRHRLALHRPVKPAEAYLRLRTLPGEQAQVDWGHFGYLQIGRAKRPLMAFVMVLSYSRMIYLRFFLDARMENFLRGHVGAFEQFGGIARVLLYDNLKSAVLERMGSTIRFHPTLLAFAGHYRYEPRPVAIARGNEKGRVERAIRYVRENFFAARTFTAIEDLNAQAEAWCLGSAADRPCPEDRSATVRETFAQEQPRLLTLPGNHFPTDERAEVLVGKTPYVRFDRNDYTVPHTHVRRTLSVLATPERVRILAGHTLLADHPRSYDQGEQVENPEHIQRLVEVKQQARQHRATDVLIQTLPPCRSFLEAAAGSGTSLARVVRELHDLLQRYPREDLQAAMEEALKRETPNIPDLRLILDRRREARRQPPPVVMVLSSAARKKDVTVTPHRLENYDQLSGGQDDAER